MRVAVTTIALNEEKFVERWAESAKDADLVFLTDTGSTDTTIWRAKDAGVKVKQVHIQPWRFDIARNVGLSLLPSSIDCVITLDVDEVLSPGWRDALEAQYSPKIDQYSYNYHWSDEIFFHGDRCHRRFGWRWQHPVHETLVCDKSTPLKVFGGFEIVHLPDETKSRGQYLDLLRLATAESPYDDRLAHYYGRELYFHGDWDAARKELSRHLSMGTWPPERAQSYRYIAMMDDNPERWILAALSETPDRREPWIDLIREYKNRGLPVDSLVERVLTIRARPVDYLTENSAWDDNYIKHLGEE